ncbi:MAG: YhcH/YjgK/YiaL family protein [Clostridia bacterium]|nr:YhcH/YjgK/YiaL family protein [Clostridia bacterium]
MIKDNIKNAKLYYGLGARFETALKFLENYSGKADERADMPVSDGVMVKCRPYVTKPQSECSFEAHRKFADIHFVVSGSEKIGYAPAGTLRIVSEDESKDMIRLEGSGVNVPLEKGDFMITFPDDAHMPCVENGSPVFCGKLVAKVEL